MSATSDETTEGLLAEVTKEFYYRNATTHLTAIGMILVLYDHILTLPDEVHFIWSARPSFAKTLFLANRYIVPVFQIASAVFWDHLGDGELPKKSCQAILTLSFVVGLCSAACANCLVILRVIALWDRNYRAAKLLALGLCVSFLSASVFLISVIIDTFDGFEYVPLFHGCFPTTTSPRLPGVWASSLTFEILVLLAVVFNALYRPHTQLRRSLYRDGILFFASLSSLQLTNLLFSVLAPPSLKLSPVLFIWAITTLILNRSLLNMHQASATQSQQRTSLLKTSSHRLSHSVEATPLSAHTGRRMPNTGTTSFSTMHSGLSLYRHQDKVVIEEIEYERPEIEELGPQASAVGFGLSDLNYNGRVQDLEDAWGIELGDRTQTQTSRF